MRDRSDHREVGRVTGYKEILTIARYTLLKIKATWEKRILPFLKRFWFEFSADVVVTDKYGYEVINGIWLMNFRQLQKLWKFPDGIPFGFDYRAPKNSDTRGTLIVSLPGGGKSTLMNIIMYQRLHDLPYNKKKSCIVYDAKSELLPILGSITNTTPDTLPFIIFLPFYLNSLGVCRT